MLLCKKTETLVCVDQRDVIDGTVSFPEKEKISRIQEKAFMFLMNLTHLNIPHGVKVIDNFAFLGCTHLASISLPNDIHEINEGLFTGCSNLRHVSLPFGIIKIKHGAFTDCISLDTFSAPLYTMYIGSKAFKGCSNLRTFSLSPAIKKVEEDAFEGCHKLQTIIIESLDDRLIERTKKLLPKHLQDRVASKAVYQGIKAIRSQMIKTFEEINRYNPRAIPLFREKVLSVPLDNLETYQVALKDLLDQEVARERSNAYLGETRHILMGVFNSSIHGLKPAPVLHPSSPLIKDFIDKKNSDRALLSVLQRLLTAETTGLSPALSAKEIDVLKSSTEASHILDAYADIIHSEAVDEKTGTLSDLTL